MKPLSFGRALRLGASTAFGRAAPPVLLALAAGGVTACLSLLWVSGLASLFFDGAGLRPAAALVAAVVAWVLQASVLGGGVQQADAALRGQTVPPLVQALGRAAPKALGWAVLVAAAFLAWNGWQLLVGGSGALLFLRGLSHHPSGLAGAFGLALVGTLGPLGALFLQLVAEMALVRAVVRNEAPSVAGYEAARALLQRPWAPVGLWLLTEVLAAAVAGVAAAFSGLAPTAPTGHLRLVAGAAVLQAAIATLARAVAQLVRLGAFCALQLDSTGELPPAPGTPAPAPPVPRAELVLEAEPILEARAVDPTPGAGG